VRPTDHSSRGVLQTVVYRMNVIAKLRIGKPRPGIRSKHDRIRKGKENYSGLKEPAMSKVLLVCDCVAVSTTYLYATRANSVRPGECLQRCSNDKQA